MTKMVTEKQLAFIKDLVGEEAYQQTESQLSMLTCQIASTVIDELKEARRQLRAKQAVPTTDVRGKPVRAEAPVGFHFYGGIVYRIRISGTGNSYATEFVPQGEGRGWSFEYRGKRPFNFLSESTLMTREQAQEFGREFGICVKCGAVLTDDERVNGTDGLTSIQRGMGPVCFKRWGM